MRTQVATVVIAVLLAACVGLVVQSATHAESPVAGRLQLVVDGGHMYMCDTTSGAIWSRFTLREGGAGTAIDEWRPETVKFAQPTAVTVHRMVIPK